MTTDSIKLVQCLLRKKKGTKSKPETRFIPYHEYELWKFYITHQYGFTISQEEIFLWLPQKDFDNKKNRLMHIDAIPVQKITLYFFLKKERVLVPLTRFFPEADYKKVKPVFMKHFDEFQDETHLTKVLEHIVEEKGFCLKTP